MSEFIEITGLAREFAEALEEMLPTETAKLSLTVEFYGDHGPLGIGGAAPPPLRVEVPLARPEPEPEPEPLKPQVGEVYFLQAGARCRAGQDVVAGTDMRVVVEELSGGPMYGEFRIRPHEDGAQFADGWPYAFVNTEDLRPAGAS